MSELFAALSLKLGLICFMSRLVNGIIERLAPESTK